MASPVGNPFIFPLDAYGYWETAGVPGATITTDKEVIVTGYTDLAPGSHHYRGVLRFKGSKSAWHDTIISAAGLHIYIHKMAAELLFSGSSIFLEAGKLNGAWTSASTIAAMNTLWNAATWTGTTIQVNAPGWFYLPFNSTWIQDAIDYGIVIRVDSGRNGTAFITTEGICPQLRSFYALSYPSGVAYATSDRRGTLSNAVLAELQKLKPQWFGRLVVTANLNKADSTQSDADLSDYLSLSSVGDWNNREIKLPESWNLEDNNPGGMTLIIPGRIEPETLTGAEVSSSFLLDSGFGIAEEVSGGKARLKRIGKMVDGRIDCALDDIYAAIREAYVPVTYSSVQIIELVFDMLVNTPRRLRTGYWTVTTEEEPGVYPGDWYWLLQRFKATWPRLNLTPSYGASVVELVVLAARLYGLFIGTGQDGRILCFHPAVYRPSMRIWTVNIDEQAAEGKAVVKRLAPVATALSTPDPDQSIIVRGRTPFSYVELGTKTVSIPLDTVIFDMPTIRKSLKYGHLQQLSYRYTDESNQLTLVTNHQALPWSHGDILLVTSDIYDLDNEPFLLLGREGGPNDIEIKITAYNWPYWQGATSLFQEDTIQGVWRWASILHAFTGASSAWGGNATSAAFAIISGTPYLHYEEWGGALVYDSANHVELSATLPIQNSPGMSDVIELPYCVSGYPMNFTVGDSVQDWWFLVWKEAATNKALCLFIHRVPFTLSPKDGAAELSSYGLGYTLDYTTNPISWVWSILAPPGVGFDSGTAGPNWDVDYLAASISDDTAELFLEGKSVGSVAWTRNNSLTTLKVRCSGGSRTMFGRLRSLILAGGRSVEERELTVANGADPFYP